MSDRVFWTIRITQTVASTAIAVLAADFIVGVFHWIEDAYLRDNCPVLGELVARPNILHHYRPRHFLEKSWLASCWDLWLVAGLILTAAWAFGVLTPAIWAFAGLVGNANQIHKWAHRSRRENGPWINLLHDLRILQGPKHHAIHHTDPKSTHYCVITEFLNPILERIRFWTRLECWLRKAFGIRRRGDTSNRRHGITPDWVLRAEHA
jgi:ubiquitin-conjugating enzyme E2 variant